MNCPVCGANAEYIISTIDGVSIACPMCGEYDVASSVLATEQLQRLELEERSHALNKAKRCAQPGVRPMITTSLLAAHIQAQWLNVHVDFPLLQRIALPVTIGAVRYPGIKIHDPRVIRLLEVLLHGGTHVGGWTARQIHHAVLTTFQLSERAYGLNHLCYDLRKLKGHALLERDGSRYAYRPTAVSTIAPIPNTDPTAAYHRADKAIEHAVQLLAAA
jgi:hypothetical protein